MIELAKNIGIVSAAALSLFAVIKSLYVGLRFTYRSLKMIDNIHVMLFDGVQRFDSIEENQKKTQDQVNEISKSLYYQFNENGGGSLIDKIKEIDTNQKQHNTIMRQINKKILQLDKQIN